MDKLPEPEFGRDKNWPRLLTGVEELQAVSESKYQQYFVVFSAASIFRYWREVTFYKKNYLTFLGVAGAFVFSSHNIAKFLTDDPYVLAAEENNRREREFIGQYKTQYSNAKKKNIDIPNSLVLI